MENAVVCKATVEQVIRVEAKEGIGSQSDPVRLVVYYFDLSGKLLFVVDPTDKEV